MPKPVVSLVFPAYNRPHEVIHSLNLFRESLTIPYEVIIIDNSPEKYQYDLKPFEHYYPQKENLGTYARNIGIKKATAPYILMLDDDSHPLPGCLEQAVSQLASADATVGGITPRVQRLDGGLESPPLLPTAFHGCGTLFRTDVIRQFSDFYPDHFCFYGEEYFSTLMFYQAGFHFEYLDDFVVCHRMSAAGRDKAKILYHLILNNRRTWRPFVPEEYLAKTEFDTDKRYQLIAAKEGVAHVYAEAGQEEVHYHSPCLMTELQFEAFALIGEFRDLIQKEAAVEGGNILLCSCGKFPTLWADLLEKEAGCTVEIADFNSGLQGQQYGRYLIKDPDGALELVEKQGFKPLLGHSARLDTKNWKALLNKKNIEYYQLNVKEIMEFKKNDERKA